MNEQCVGQGFQFLFEKTDYLLALLSEEGLILHISKALAALYGWEPVAAQGKNFFSLIKKLKVKPPYTLKEIALLSLNKNTQSREQSIQLEDRNYIVQWSVDLVSEQPEKLYMLRGTDTTIQHKAELMVKRTVANLESIVACMPGNVYWTDKNSVYLGCNDNVAKMLGLKSASEVIGTSYKEHAEWANWTQGQGDSFRQDDLEVIRTGKPKLNVEEPPVTDASGNTIYFLTSRVPLKDENGNCTGVVGISIDITELHDTRFELDSTRFENTDLKDEVTLANREKCIFIFVLSARVLNALSAVKTVSELFYQSIDKLPDGYAELLALMDSAIRKIIHMFDHMTDFLDLQEDNIEEISIQRMAESVVRECIDNMEKKSVVVLVDFDRLLPSKQLGDDDRIRRVLRNLIENAVNYTEKGSIKVKICIEEQYDQEYLLKIIIQDTGCGIPPERLKGLFDVFERTTIENNPYQSGGFILSLTKKLIERLSGSIDVSSQPGKGTIFIIEVPVTIPQNIRGEEVPHYPTLTISPFILSDNEYFLETLKTFISFKSSLSYSSKESSWERANHISWCEENIAIIDGRINVSVLHSFVNYLSPIIGEHSFFVVVVDKDEAIDYSSVLPSNWVAVSLTLPLTPFSIEEELIQEYQKWQRGQLSTLHWVLTPQALQKI